MTEAGGGFDLPEKPLPPEGGCELRRQHLDRDGATVLQVLRKVDRGHSPAPQLALDRVATGEGGLNVGEEGVHRGGFVCVTTPSLEPGALTGRAVRPGGAGFCAVPRNFAYPVSPSPPYRPTHARPRLLLRRALDRRLSGGRRNRHRE